jgi:hypothetical protein
VNYSNAFNPSLPVIPARVNGGVLRHNGFPENFIVTNPQFSNVFMIASVNHNNYHSMEAQVRPLRQLCGICAHSMLSRMRLVKSCCRIRSPQAAAALVCVRWKGPEYGVSMRT